MHPLRMLRSLNFRRTAWLSCLLAALGLAIPSEALTISKRPAVGRDNILSLLITGPLVPGDAARITAALKQRPKEAVDDQNWLHIYIDSEGGDVNEALKIGYLLRSQNASTNVWSKRVIKVGQSSARCVSSCVFVYMAGVMRMADDGPKRSLLGIHRPYLGSAKVGQDFEASYQRLRRELEAYFEKMHVSKALLDLMYSVPPEQVRYLTPAETEAMLPFQDPVYDELRTTGWASIYGITNAEYRRRSVKKEVCTEKLISGEFDFERYEKCGEAILWGISEKELDRRSKEKRATNRK